MVVAIVIHLPDHGLPVWAQAILSVVGCGIAFGLLYGLYRLSTLPRDRRLKKRVAAVEAATGDDPVYGSGTVRAAAAALYLAAQEAWDAGDRDALACVSDPGLMAAWAATLDRDEAAGVRKRVEVRNGPDIDYIGVHADHDHGYVRVRVCADLLCRTEPRDGSWAPARGVPVEEYWTLSRRAGEWIAYSIRTADHEAEYLAEAIVGPRPASRV